MFPQRPTKLSQKESRSSSSVLLLLLLLLLVRRYLLLSFFYQLCLNVMQQSSGEKMRVKKKIQLGLAQLSLAYVRTFILRRGTRSRKKRERGKEGREKKTRKIILEKKEKQDDDIYAAAAGLKRYFCRYKQEISDEIKLSIDHHNSVYFLLLFFLIF